MILVVDEMFRSEQSLNHHHKVGHLTVAKYNMRKKRNFCKYLLVRKATKCKESSTRIEVK